MKTNRPKSNKTTLCIFLVCIAFTIGACGSGSDTGDTDTGEISVYEDTGFAMGTVVSQTIYTTGNNIASEITDLLTETENKWISWRVDDSEISKINAAAGKKSGVEVSDPTREYIATALSIAKHSKGAFDPTVGNLTRLWGFDEEAATVPEDKDIKALLPYIGYDRITLAGNTVTLSENTSIDLGAIGKGIGTDQIQQYAENHKEITGLLVNVGGSSIIVYGNKDTGEPWKVAVLDPRNEEGYLGAISLEGTRHVSTSGDYEKYFEQDGERYHHILDPSTGYPAKSGLISVTVVADNGAECDALSTACFVLGKEKALDLLKEYNAEAVFVDEDKNVYVTEGLEDKFELLADSGYKVVKQSMDKIE